MGLPYYFLAARSLIFIAFLFIDFNDHDFNFWNKNQDCWFLVSRPFLTKLLDEWVTLWLLHILFFVLVSEEIERCQPLGIYADYFIINSVPAQVVHLHQLFAFIWSIANSLNSSLAPNMICVLDINIFTDLQLVRIEKPLLTPLIIFSFLWEVLFSYAWFPPYSMLKCLLRIVYFFKMDAVR